MSDVRNLIIIGSGPAGLTAAIYASRAQLKPLLVEGMIMGGSPGGQLMLTGEVENYPGFPGGMAGSELMDLFRKQAERFGTEFASGDVTEVDFSKKPFAVKTDSKTYLAQSVIIATGASARWMGIESEKKLQGFGVSACATCDGAFFKNKDVLVVGGGDSAMEEALFLTRFANKVSIIHRRDALRASKIMQERVFNHDKVEVVWNSVIEEILDVSAKKVTGVILKNTKDGSKSEMKCDGIFMSLGHDPNTSVFRGKVDLDEKGYVKVTKGAETTVPGVFAAGDVQDHIYRQAITASGSGCMAALDAERYLADL